MQQKHIITHDHSNGVMCNKSLLWKSVLYLTSDHEENDFPEEAQALTESISVSCCEIYLVKLLFSGKAQAVHRVSPAVCPLAELLWCLSERHVGCDGAVDDSL